MHTYPPFVSFFIFLGPYPAMLRNHSWRAERTMWMPGIKFELASCKVNKPCLLYGSIFLSVQLVLNVGWSSELEVRIYQKITE